MKKIILTAVASMGLFILTSCGDPIRSHNLKTADITNTYGNKQETFVNPTSIAVLNWSVLDILYTVNAFERLGFLESIIIPRTSTPPAFLNEGNIDFRSDNQIVRADGTTIEIHNSGSLHYVNEAMLLFVQPQVVFLDHRSFAQTGSGASQNASDQLTRVSNRFRYTRFLHTYADITSPELCLEDDLGMIVDAISIIFPSLADDLYIEYNQTVSQFHLIYDQMKDFNAIHVSLQNGITVHGLNSRWGFIFNTFGFNTNVIDSQTNLVHTAFATVPNLRDADVITVFTHPNAGANEFRDFYQNESVLQTRASLNNGIIRIRAAAWHSSPLGFTSASWMIQDMEDLLTQMEEVASFSLLRT